MTQPQIRLGHVAFVCADLDRTRAFYEELLDLRTLTVTP